MAEHAFLAPSSAHRVVACAASVRQEPKYQDTPKRYTAEGTLAHELGAMTLTGEIVLADKLGKTFEVDGFEFTVDKDMIKHVQGYVDFVNAEALGADAVLIEKKVRYGPMVFQHDDVLTATVITPDGVEVHAELHAEEIGYGTSDAIIVKGRRVSVIDLKYGYTRVWAESNEQGMLYALGALYEFAWMGDFDEVEVIIYQPRVDPEAPFNRWVVSVADLMIFAAKFREAALYALNDPAPVYNPGEKQCQFCKVGPHCEARRNGMFGVMAEVTPAVASDFDDLPALAQEVRTIRADDMEWLSKAMQNVGMIEDWCKAIRGEVDRIMLSGGDVPGFKLVEGRAGNRKWKNPDLVEALLRKTWRMKIEDVYELSLISPTATEKLLKSNKARWAKLQTQIERASGKPSVAAIEDKRPALTLTATAEDFA